MKPLRLAALLPLLLASPTVADDEKKPADGFVPMFNGKDLTGWVNVNCHPDTFAIKDGVFVTTGKPTGFLRTEKQYENFVAEFDWMHVPPKPDASGNSGFFVWADPIPAVGTGYTRGIEVQVLVNLEKKDAYTSHGDIFSIWGATCKPDRPHPMGWERCLPSERRAKGANEWNHYKVTANDGTIKLEVNGKEVSGVSACKPRKGYLALESEGSECRFKSLVIKELPSTNPKPEEVADVDKGFRNIYFGDLTGWKDKDGLKDVWTPRDWMLVNTGKGEGKKDLLSEKEYGDYEMIVDFRIPAKGKGEAGVATYDGESMHGTLKVGETIGFELTDATRGMGVGSRGTVDALKPTGQWNRLVVTRKGNKFSATINGKEAGSGPPAGKLGKGRVGLRDTGAPVEYANLLIRELK
jgi:hypothetical protein